MPTDFHYMIELTKCTPKIFKKLVVCEATKLMTSYGLTYTYISYIYICDGTWICLICGQLSDIGILRVWMYHNHQININTDAFIYSSYFVLNV